MKKCIAICILWAMLMSLMPVNALVETIDVSILQCSIKDKILSYEGRISTEAVVPVTVMVKDKKTQKIKYLNVIKTDENGCFGGSIEIYDSEDSPVFYEAQILFETRNSDAVTEKVDVFFNNKMRDDSINTLNVTSDDAIHHMTTTVEKNAIYKNLGIWLEIYNLEDETTREKIDKVANKYKTLYNASNIVEYANGSIAATISNDMNSMELKELVKKLDDEVKKISVENVRFDVIENDMEHLDDKEQKWVIDNLLANKKSEFANLEDLYHAIRESMFLEIVNELPYMQIADLILNNTDILDNEMSKLKNQSSTKVIDEAMETIAVQAANNKFVTISDFISAVDDAIDEAIQNPVTPPQGNGSISQGGGSSGGGGGGRYSVSVGNDDLPQVEENTKNEEILTKGFGDITEEYGWAKLAIEKLAALGIISGTGNGNFEPGRLVKREEFVKMICGVFGLNCIVGSSKFKDVEKDAWYFNYVSATEEAGVINGVSEETFGVGENISREDMATIIYRVLMKEGYSLGGTGNAFKDEHEIADYAKVPVSMLYHKGIISGIGDNTFSPKSNATRAEATMIFYRCLEFIPAE